MWSKYYIKLFIVNFKINSSNLKFTINDFINIIVLYFTGHLNIYELLKNCHLKKTIKYIE